ncbi:MAG TPA: hypothetical protein PKC30_00310 [Saprospiraceae bacterium]|nr:hypothetical protein [Saprospiraceae bacterium]
MIYSQTKTDLLFLSAETYNPHKYREKIGNPYYFDHWMLGDAYDISGELYSTLFMNYNIMESQWEVRRMDKVVALDPTVFWCVIIHKQWNDYIWKYSQDSLLFIRGLLPKNEYRFAKVVYNGKKLRLYKDMQIHESSEKIFDKGKSAALNKLYRKDKYVLFKNGKIMDAGYTMLDIIGKTGHKEKILQYLNSRQMKFNEDNDLALLMEYIEQNFIMQ